jgi:hypothetical protein
MHAPLHHVAAAAIVVVGIIIGVARIAVVVPVIVGVIESVAYAASNDADRKSVVKAMVETSGSPATGKSGIGIEGVAAAESTAANDWTRPEPAADTARTKATAAAESSRMEAAAAEAATMETATATAMKAAATAAKASAGRSDVRRQRADSNSCQYKNHYFT